MSVRLVFAGKTGREMTAEQGAYYLAAGLLLDELKCRSGPMAHAYPMTEHEIALRVAVETLRRELLHRSGEEGYEPVTDEGSS